MDVKKGGQRGSNSIASMSDTNTNNTNAESLDEELVAYLDGELDSQGTQRIENMLASDAQARQRLNQLASSWDLLDQLPRATVDDLFTKTTVEMVALAAEDEINKTVAAEPARRRMRLLGGVIAAAVALFVGFVAVAVALPDRNDELLRYLPVVHDLELYRAVGDIKLLKLFQEKGMFTEDVPSSAASALPGEKSIAAQPSNLSLPIPDSIEARRGWVESLSAAEKSELRRDFQNFTSLPATEQQSLWQFAQQLQSDPQHEELKHIMVRYNDWLKTLQPADRADLADKSPDARVAEIRDRQQLDESRALAAFGDAASARHFERSGRLRNLVAWMQSFAKSHEEQIISQLPEELKKTGATLKEQPDRIAKTG